jgi:hypothetical protein
MDLTGLSGALSSPRLQHCSSGHQTCQHLALRQRSPVLPSSAPLSAHPRLSLSLSLPSCLLCCPVWLGEVAQLSDFGLATEVTSSDETEADNKAEVTPPSHLFTLLPPHSVSLSLCDCLCGWLRWERHTTPLQR